MKSRRIPVRKFFRDPKSLGYGLSPNGEMISSLRRWKGRLNIFVQVGPHGRAKPVTQETEHDIGEYFWKGNGCLIYTQGSHLYRLDLESSKVGDDITPVKNVSIALVADLEGVSEDEILIQLKEGERGIFDVYRLNVRSRENKIAAWNPGTARRWIADNAGLVRAAISVDGMNDCLLTRPDEESEFTARPMDFRYSINRFSSLFYTSDNKGIFAISNMRRNRDKAAVAIISADTGKEIRRLYKNRHADVESFGFSKKWKVVTYASVHTSKLKQKALDRRTAAIFRTLKKSLRRYVIEIIAHDASEEKFIVLASNDRTPGKRYLFDMPTGRLTKLEEVAPWLKEKQLARVCPIKFKSRDRLTIHGYLTLPRGRKPKNLPLVVNVHGGPENRDYWQYYPPESAEVQFLANRGYAVLQVNFRGSAGYGRSFWKKGFRQRGRKMQCDVTDGVRHLIDIGIADPKRVAIYGKSYGGYAALAGVAFTPDLYQAAIAYAGVSNWVTWLESELRDKQSLLRNYVKVGHPKKDRKWLEAVAPALQADRIKVPLFLAHGANDRDVSRTESDQMVAAIQGSDVDYMVKANERHTFEKEKNKIAFYKAMETFLAKHLR